MNSSPLISHPDLLLGKPTARSGQVGKLNCFDWLDCERMTWWGHLRAQWRVQFILCKVQINISTEEVVFRLNITCNTIFNLPSKFFTTLSRTVSILRLLKRVKNSRVQVDLYCFELLARATTINFKPTVALNLMLQRRRRTTN